MNERIKELAEQARKHFPKTETSGEFWVFDEEKFAELIVRECLAICEELGADYDCHFAADKIAKRFLRS